MGQGLLGKSSTRVGQMGSREWTRRAVKNGGGRREGMGQSYRRRGIGQLSRNGEGGVTRGTGNRSRVTGWDLGAGKRNDGPVEGSMNRTRGS